MLNSRRYQKEKTICSATPEFPEMNLPPKSFTKTNIDSFNKKVSESPFYLKESVAPSCNIKRYSDKYISNSLSNSLLVVDTQFLPAELVSGSKYKTREFDIKKVFAGKDKDKELVELSEEEFEEPDSEIDEEGCDYAVDYFDSADDGEND